MATEVWVATATLGEWVTERDGSDGAVVLEEVVLWGVKAAHDAPRTADTSRLGIGKRSPDTAHATDALRRVLAKVLRDPVRTTDRASLFAGHVPSGASRDGAGATDRAALALARGRSDAAHVADRASIGATKAASDGVSSSDIVTRAWDARRDQADSAAVADAARLLVGQGHDEAVFLADDDVTLDAGLVAVDALSPTDAIELIAESVAADSAACADTAALSVGSALRDVAAASDFLSFYLYSGGAAYAGDYATGYFDSDYTS